MLVLTRKLQEKIQIGNDITITVLRVKGNMVRIGIEAPRDVRVMRAELPRFDEVPTGALQATADKEASVDDQGQLVGAVGLVSTDANAESVPLAQEPAGKTPSVGRRFIIQQKAGRFGRPQITAVAAT